MERVNYVFVTFNVKTRQSAAEYRGYKGIDDTNAFIVDYDRATGKQNCILKERRKKFFLLMRVSSFWGKFAYTLAVAKTLRPECLNKSASFTLVSSHYDNPFVMLLYALLDANEFICIDDGFKTLAIAELRKKESECLLNNYKETRSWQRINGIYRILLGFYCKIKNIELNLPKQFVFFTSYPVNTAKKSNDRVEIIDHQTLGKGLKNKRARSKEIHFLAQPLISLNILDVETLEKLYYSVKDRFGCPEFRYVVHPRECNIQVALAKRIFGDGVVVELGGNYEEVAIKSEGTPKTVVTFYSSVIFNLYSLNAPCQLISLDIKDHCSKFEEEINLSYKCIQGISVVETLKVRV